MKKTIILITIGHNVSKLSLLLLLLRRRRRKNCSFVRSLNGRPNDLPVVSSICLLLSGHPAMPEVPSGYMSGGASTRVTSIVGMHVIGRKRPGLRMRAIRGMAAAGGDPKPRDASRLRANGAINVFISTRHSTNKSKSGL